MLEHGAMSLEKRVEVLAKSALFQNLAGDALADLASHACEHRLHSGQILFTANEPSHGLYIVLKGSVRAFRVNVDGREQTIHIERAGGMLAEVTVFDDGPYPSSAVAEEDSVVLFFGKKQIHDFLLRHPQAAFAALAIMAKKLRIVASLAEHLALKDVGQRLAMLLLEEAQRSTSPLRDGASFSLPLSHAQIASRLGSVREVVTRGLQKLIQQGVIEVRGHRVVVRNVKALRAQTENHPKSLPHAVPASQSPSV